MEDAEYSTLYDLLVGDSSVNVKVGFDTYTAVILGVILFLAITGAMVLSGSLIKSL